MWIFPFSKCEFSRHVILGIKFFLNANFHSWPIRYELSRFRIRWTWCYLWNLNCLCENPRRLGHDLWWAHRGAWQNVDYVLSCFDVRVPQIYPQFSKTDRRNDIFSKFCSNQSCEMCRIDLKRFILFMIKKCFKKNCFTQFSTCWDGNMCGGGCAL